MIPIEPTHTRITQEIKFGSPLIGCRFDPSGRYLFVTAQDNHLYRHDFATGQKLSFPGHSSWSRGLAFLGKPALFPLAGSALNGVAGSMVGLVLGGRASGSTLISADYLGQLRWWDADSPAPKPIRVVQAHDGWVRAIAVSPDQKLVASCGNDHLVKLWNAADGQLIRTIEGHSCHVYNVAFHPDGKSLISADLKGNLRDCEVSSGKLLRELDGKVFHKYDAGFGADIGGIRGMGYHPDGKSLVCIGITNVSNAFAGVGNPLVLLFDLKDGKAKPCKPKDAFQGTGWGVGFLPNGMILGAGGGGQGRVWFWKPDDQVNVHTVTVPVNARDMAIHPDGSAFAVAGSNGSAYVYTMTAMTNPPKAPTPAPAKK